LLCFIDHLFGVVKSVCCVLQIQHVLIVRLYGNVFSIVLFL